MSDDPNNNWASSLAAALAALQTKLPEVHKTQQGQVGNQRTRYADLANISQQVLPLLADLGMSFSARPTLNGNGVFVLAYELLHISGQSRTGEYPLLGNTPQAHGSAITYARRYTLCAITGVAPEDDDDAATAQAEVQAGGRTAQRAARQPAPTSGRADQATAQRATRARPEGGQPPLPGEDKPANPNMRTAAQVGTMLALFKKAGIEDRAIRLAVCGQIADRQLESANDLTKREASKVIDLMMRVVDDEDPIAALSREIGIPEDDLVPEGNPE
jgi:hypothetical protein